MLIDKHSKFLKRLSFLDSLRNVVIFSVPHRPIDEIGEMYRTRVISFLLIVQKKNNIMLMKN